MILLLTLVLVGAAGDYTIETGYGPEESVTLRYEVLPIITALRQCKESPRCKGVVVKMGEAQEEVPVAFLMEDMELVKRNGFTTYQKLPVSEEEKMVEDEEAAEEVEEGKEDVEKQQEEEEEDDDEDENNEADGPPPSEWSEEQYAKGTAALFAPDFGERNVSLAFEHYNASASEGHAGAQFMLGFMYSLGLGTEPSEMMAVLHYTFSAMSGNVDASMVLSYRYNYGYGVPKSCTDAKRYYKLVADKVARMHRFHAVAPAVDKVRLSDPVALRTRQKEEDLLQYYQYNADRGDAASQMVLGYAFMYGIRGVEQDAMQALRYFQMAASQGQAAAYGALGTIYAQGIDSAESPLEKDYAKAHEYFKKGTELNHAVSWNGMGYLAMKGKGVPKNYTAAVSYFEKAAVSKNPEALYNLGVLHREGLGVKKPDRAVGTGYLTSAANQGQILAHWQLGIDESGKSCEVSVNHLKTVSEHGKWARRMEDAHRDYLDGDYGSALLRYLIAAEQGYEIGHSNAAFMLDNDLGYDELGFIPNPAYLAPNLPENVTSDPTFPRYSLALKYYKKAMEQDTVDAIVKVGDYHYYGLGTAVDLAAALASYKLGMVRSSHQAMFNLGYMHEYGISIDQDFHLAKRYYDQAFHSSDHAYWPITLALLKLHAHWWYVDTFYSSTALPPAAASKLAKDAKAKGNDSYMRLWGHKVEDIILGTLLVLLFFTLFIRHTARQVNAPAEPAEAQEAPPAPVPAVPAPAPAPPQEPVAEVVEQPAEQTVAPAEPAEPATPPALETDSHRTSTDAE